MEGLALKFSSFELTFTFLFVYVYWIWTTTTTTTTRVWWMITTHPMEQCLSVCVSSKSNKRIDLSNLFSKCWFHQYIRTPTFHNTYLRFLQAALISSGDNHFNPADTQHNEAVIITLKNVLGIVITSSVSRDVYLSPSCQKHNLLGDLGVSSGPGVPELIMGLNKYSFLRYQPQTGGIAGAIIRVTCPVVKSLEFFCRFLLRVLNLQKSCSDLT